MQYTWSAGLLRRRDCRKQVNRGIKITRSILCMPCLIHAFQAYMAPFDHALCPVQFPTKGKKLAGMLSEETMSSSVGQSSRTSVKIAPGAIVCNESELRGTVFFRIYRYIFHFCFLNQCCGYVTFLYGFWDPCLWPMDPASDPAIFVIDLQQANKKNCFSAYYFLKVHLHHFSKIKSQKDVTKQ